MKHNTFLQSVWRLALLALLVVAAAALSPVARAAEFTAADEAALNEAITAVNAAGAGEHTITLSADITLSAPLPALSNSEADKILIDGDGHLLNAAGVGTALVVQSGTTATIQNITISGGVGSSFPNGQSGGGLANRGHLTVINSTISGNSAATGGGIVNDGANSAVLILEGVTLSENETTDFGAGLFNTAQDGTAAVTITGSNIIDNVAGGPGGGIANHGLGGVATLDISNSTVAGNDAVEGGGIFNNGNAGEATLTLTGVTLWNNTAATNGGGILNNGNLGAATVTLTNSTVSANSALNGGGFLNSPNSGTVNLTLTFTTVTGNIAATGSGLVNRFGGTVTLGASILTAGEQSAACATVGGAVITSAGFNIDSDNSCGLTGIGDLPERDPLLEPLALNAPGATQTHAIADESPAHSVAPTGTLGCGETIATDQRGAPRPMPEPLCDIGAYESEFSGEEPPPTCEAPYAPTDELELNAAIECVNAAGPGNHLITLANSIHLSASSLPISNPEADEIVLAGAGYILSGNVSGTILTIEPDTTVRVQDITITGGQGTSGPNGDWGGGIYNRGLLTIQNSTITGNSAERGGGVVNYGDVSSAELTIVRSTLSGNSAVGAGGAILNSSNDVGSATLNIVNSTLSSNSADMGGGLFNETFGGTTGANLVYTTIAGNTATNGGGGIHTLADGGNSSVTLAATIISSGSGGAPDCARPSGVIISTGYNLAGDNSCNLTQLNDQPSAEAGLLPLALNAPGQTATHALGSDSDAIDAIHFGAAGCGTAVTTDQRGAPRPEPADGTCDVGAFEVPSEVIEEPEPIIYLPMVADFDIR